MNIQELDRYLRSKDGVTVQKFAPASAQCVANRYLLNDIMFAKIYFSSPPVMAVKANDNRLEYYRAKYGINVRAAEELEPLHWNDILLDGNIADNVVIAAADESYELVLSSLTQHAKKALDPSESNYGYVLKNFDLAKEMEKNVKTTN